MLRLALFATVLLTGCASTRTNAIADVGSSEGLVVIAPDAETLAPAPAESESDAYAEPFGALEFKTSLTTDALEPAPLSFSPEHDESLHGDRFTIKAGLYSSEEDALDDGWIVNAAWMTYFSKLFALEFELGYLDADGSDGGVDTDLWAIPVMVNARLNLPIWVLDAYGGVGIGGFYYDVDNDIGGEDDGFLWGGNAFVGATINIADSVALGLEGKYYITDEIDEFDESLDAFALMVTLGFSQ